MHASMLPSANPECSLLLGGERRPVGRLPLSGLSALKRVSADVLRLPSSP